MDILGKRTLLQWGPVVVTGIRGLVSSGELDRRLNASMGSGRGDRNQVFPDTWDELQAR